MGRIDDLSAMKDRAAYALSRRLLAVDPGLGKKLGWAVFVAGQLVQAGNGDLAAIQFCECSVIEQPTVYSHGTKKVDPKDLISIALAGALFAGAHTIAGAPMWRYEPRTWKKQLPKDVHHRRAWPVLIPVELQIFQSANEDARDAVCLGLFQLERLVIR